MKGLGRNVKFWVWMLNKALAAMWCTVFLIGVVCSFMEGDWSSFADFIPSYMLMFTFLTVFINAMNTNVMCFPISVSLGSVRKQSCIGMQIGQHIVALELVLLLCVCNLIFPEAEQAILTKTYPLSFLGVYLFLLGLGTMISAISIRCSKGLGMVIYLLVVIGMIALGAGIALTVMTNGIKPGNEILRLLDSPLPLITGILVDVAMAFVHFAAVRKLDLKLA